jgi:hypothetical protein
MPPLNVRGIALPFYTYMIFLPHRDHTYGPPRPVTGKFISLTYRKTTRNGCVLNFSLFLLLEFLAAKLEVSGSIRNATRFCE